MALIAELKKTTRVKSESSHRHEAVRPWGGRAALASTLFDAQHEHPISNNALDAALAEISCLIP